MSIDTKKIIAMSKDLKLLYVEDDINTRETTKGFLSNFFKDITIAIDGMGGIQKFKKQKFDFILSIYWR